MKKTFKFAIYLIMALVFTTSCSENMKMEALLEQIPANTDFVAVGDAKTIIESAGGSIDNSKVKLPTSLLNALPDDTEKGLDDANSFLGRSGIDVEACAMMANYKDERAVVVFTLADPQKFKEAIERNKYIDKKAEGDVVIYSKKTYESEDSQYDDYDYIATNGSYAYWIGSVWVGSDFKPLDYLQNVIDDAKEENFAKTKCGDYIIDGNAGGVAAKFPRELSKEMSKRGLPEDIVSLYDGTICFHGNLSATDCTVDAKFFDENGNEVDNERYKKLFDISSTINSDALALLGDGEFMVGAMSLKDVNWENYADMVATTSGLSREDRAEFDATLGYLEKIDGTIAWGFGLTNGWESAKNMSTANDVMSQFSTTFVVETKDGKAKRLMDDMKGFLTKAGTPFEETSTGFTVNSGSSDVPGTLYVKNIGNFIVAANHPIKEVNDNPLVKSSNLSDYLAALTIRLDKSSKLMRDLNINSNISLCLYTKPNMDETSMKLTVDGDEKTGVISKVIKILLSINSHAKDLNLGGQSAYTDDVVVEDTVEWVAPDTTVVDDDYYYYPEDSAY